MIYGVETTGQSLEILKWSDRKTAERAGNNWLLIENEKQLNESSISTGTLAALWNHHNPDTPVKRFADREEGAKQVFAIFERVAISAKKLSAHEGEKEVAKGATAKKGAAKAPAKKGTGAKGKGNPANLKVRKSKYTGMKLTASAEAKKANPRKEGSHGYRSMEIIRNNPGITYEEFIAKGGRGNDLEWDVTKGNVTTK